jgi:fatty acid desaturase
MPTQMTEEEIYKEARKKVEEKRGFRTHFIVYLCVNALLVIIWAVTGRGNGVPWFVFPLGGWGIGVLFHFLNVYVFSQEADDREIEREAEKIRKRRGGNIS